MQESNLERFQIHAILGGLLRSVQFVVVEASDEEEAISNFLYYHPSWVIERVTRL